MEPRIAWRGGAATKGVLFDHETHESHEMESKSYREWTRSGAKIGQGVL
jgi:hypothetical protein